MMVKLDRIEHTVEIPEGVTVTYNKPMITVQGPLGENMEEF